MNQPALTELSQYIAFFLATLELILALYILLLNPWHSANRHVGLLFFFATLATTGQAILIGATSVEQARLATYLLTATVAGIQPLLLITAVVLIKPSWMPGSGRARSLGRWRWIWHLVYVLVFLPTVLTLVDTFLGTQLWYTGLDLQTYGGGVVSSGTFTQGSLAGLIKLFDFQIIPLLTFVPLFYVAIWDKTVTRLTRRLAWVLFAGQVVTIGAALGLGAVLPLPWPDLLSTVSLVLVYVYVIFQQMVSERRVQRGRLRPRLTVLILVVAVPMLIAVPTLLSLRTGTELEQNAAEQLRATNRALRDNVSVWLDYNVRALHQLVALPDIVSMDPVRQKPMLVLTAETYPHLFLVQTTDRDGFNVARNDDQENRDYSDRVWYQGAIQGAPVTFQSLVSRTTGNPALNMSAPIRDEAGQIVGVGSIVSHLDDIAREVQVSTVGETGFAYIVDATDRAVAHPDPAFTAELRLLDTYPSVSALRQGTRGLYAFIDDEGVQWQAYLDELDNGWGVVVQQQVDELLSVRQRFMNLATILTLIGTIILGLLTWLTIAQAFQPITSLTETAGAIAAGDLTAMAPVESEDEIGVLARTFNSMTAQLRELIGSLEERVAERTRDLARRTRYLEATAEVGRAAASILEADRLIREAVELIRERFGLYYVGLFLVEEGREWAVLQAGTGEAGRAMLARGHRIRVGEGMIGWSVAFGDSRVAEEAGADAVRLATAELPGTRSEAALPLRSRGEVLGALSVQHTDPGAFDPDTMTVLQTMADQLAATLDNARLLQQAETALDAERRAYGELSRQAWAQVLRTRTGLGYRSDEAGVVPVGNGGDRAEGAAEAEQTGPALPEVALPVTVHGQVLGTIEAHKPEGSGEWTPQELELLQGLAAQLSQALESARLYQDTQRRAARDRMLAETSARMRESLDVEVVLKTAVDEIAGALGLAALDLRLGTEKEHE